MDISWRTTSQISGTDLSANPSALHARSKGCDALIVHQGFAPIHSPYSPFIFYTVNIFHRPLSTQGTSGSYNYKPDSLERAILSTRRKTRFKDIVKILIRDDVHHELNRKLKEAADEIEPEKSKKSQKELGEISNKKMRAF